MVGLFQLKHLHRNPLNLDSLPDRLCEQIISKQSAAAIFNLLHTNVKYCSMVELILSRNPNVELIRKVLQHGKEKLLRPEHITALFPPPSRSKDKLFWRNINLDGWLQAIRKDIDFFFCISTGNNDSVKSLLKQMTPTTYHISELWEQQQHLGLKEIPLQSIPVHLWTDILKKATAVSATRLVKINSTVAAVFDVYVESAGLVRTVIQNEHLLPKDPRKLPNENKPIGVAALEYKYQLLDFHMKTLLANALGYLWCPSSSPNLPFTVKDKAPVEKKHEQVKKDTQKVLKESCPKRMEAWEDINTLLGYAHLPRKRYTLDGKPVTGNSLPPLSS